MKVEVKQYCESEKVAELRDYVSSVLTQGTYSGGRIEDLDENIRLIALAIGALVENLTSKNLLTLHEITQILPGEGWTKLSEAEV